MWQTGSLSLVAYKNIHYGLRDSKLAEGKSVSGHRQKKQKTNKARTDYEPCLAQGRAGK